MFYFWEGSSLAGQESAGLLSIGDIFLLTLKFTYTNPIQSASVTIQYQTSAQCAHPSIMGTVFSNLVVIAFFNATISSLWISNYRQPNSVVNRKSFGFLNIKLTATDTCLFADVDDGEKSGYFQLPKLDNIEDVRYSRSLRSFEDNYNEMPDNLPVDDAMKKRLFRQLLFAFDNYQEPEIIQICQKILKMPAQLKKLLQLTTRAEEIEAAAEEGGGFDEYLYDALRSTRSEIRMYGKDAEFYDEEGNDIRGMDKDRFLWPWESK